MKTTKIKGSEIATTNLHVFHIWGSIRRTSISKFVASTNIKKVIKIYRRCKSVYVSPASYQLNKSYEVIN